MLLFALGNNYEDLLTVTDAGKSGAGAWVAGREGNFKIIDKRRWRGREGQRRENWRNKTIAGGSGSVLRGGCSCRVRGGCPAGPRVTAKHQ